MDYPDDYTLPEEAPQPHEDRPTVHNRERSAHRTGPILPAELGLPAAVNAETTILGAILLDNQAFSEAIEKLEPEDFSLDSHRRIFQRMADLMATQHAVDIVTLANELGRHKEVESVGGVAYLASLTEGLPRRPVIGEYIAIVKDKSLLRKLMGISDLAIKRAADQGESAFEIIEAATEHLQRLQEQGLSSPLQTFGAFVEKQYASIDAVFQKSARSQGLPSGLKELDELTCGFQRGELIIFAARPSLGKTAGAVGFARYASIDLGKTVAFFSLEMGKELILHRLVAQQSSISLTDIREGRWTETTRRYRVEAMSAIVEAPLYIDDQKGLTVQKMRAKAARLKSQTGHLDLVIIDQLNHIKSPAGSERYGNRRIEIGLITRDLKAMADYLDVPVMVLHQLSRETEKRDDKRPRLSDLRESGDVEQDADLVIFPHRDSYYKKSDDAKENRKAELIVAKQRNGPTGRADCEFWAERGLFCDVEERASLWP